MSEQLFSWMRDIRYAIRSLRKSRALTAAAVATLALGIGANTAIFSVFRGVVLAPLPYHDPGRLVLVLLFNRSLHYATELAYPEFLDWQRSSRSFQSIGAFAAAGFDLTSPGRAEHVFGKEVSASFFDTLQVQFALGRNFGPDADRTGGSADAVISYRLWKDHFGASPSALGRSVTLNAVDYTVVGILPAAFRFDNQEADVYTPLGRRDSAYNADRTIHDLVCVARLKPGVALGQAQAELGAIQEEIDRLNPSTERGLGISISPLKEMLIGDVSKTLTLLLGAVALVLLIACANVANLLLGRSAARVREFGVRLALGANRAQIIRQLVAESVVLSLAGGLAGLAIAKWAPSLILAAVPGAVPRLENIGVNLDVLIFALGVSVLAGIVFGLAPAFRSSKIDVYDSLRGSGRGIAGGHRGTQSALVVVQIALALVLQTGGSLLLRTIYNLGRVNPGFDARDVTTFQVGLSSKITTGPGMRAAFRNLVSRIREIPGVQAADLTALVPLSRNFNEGPFWVGTQKPAASMAEIPRAIYYPIGPEYTRTLKIPLVAGRYLSDADNTNSDLVVLIDSQLLRKYFPDGDAVGKILTIPHWGASSNVPARIAGVVGHVEHYGLDGSAGEKPQLYYSFYQLPDDAIPIFRSEVAVAVRTRLNRSALMPALRDAANQAGGDQPIYNIHTMRELALASIGRQRLAAMLLVSFAILAVSLALVGTYGVISYSMTRRVQEIGVRMALGAQRSDVVRLVLAQGFRLAIAGVAIGTLSALILGSAASNFSRLLYGVDVHDPATYAGASLILIAAAILACYAPARRATRLDPMLALRHE